MKLHAGYDALSLQGCYNNVNPSNGEVFLEIPEANESAVDAIIDSAYSTAFDPAWRYMAPLQREQLLTRWADLIEDDLANLAALESLDTGKPVTLAETVDVQTTLSWLRTYAGWPTKLTGQSTHMAGQSIDQFHSFTQREPVGVVAAITPWNFPMVLAMWKLAPALASGCTVVLKPAPETPLSALRLWELAKQAGFPAGAFSVVTGGPEVGAALTSHPKISKIAFTGSSRTGQKILASSIPDFKRVTLELGGKSPSIITASANLDKAIPEAAMACFFNSGQVCYAGTRLYVHSSRYSQVLEGLATLADTLKLGPGWDRNSQLGPLISEVHLQKVTGMVLGAEQEGATLVNQPQAVTGGGFFYAPRIYTDVHPTSQIAREEIFGPVLVVTPFDEIDEAIELANESPYGLAAHVWSERLSEAHEYINRLQVGSVFVNCMLMADPTLPFGGMKASGIGRENGEAVFDAYLETKSAVISLS
ncbi:aldehyde dehydrogenase family protein [Halioxenophilus sp. WMMB6]|uniref:aldehyde dehydrogenase family protein n=1 Tax=Halioxenophilus sp. WMMB6 TaxID=3073815 RepID=UPI00295F0D9A|nr:aldehyde dehydrogenase family protein [Halioxenophilus sp. WMMB6]